LQNFQHNVIGNGPQSEAADGEKKNSCSNAEDQATLRATQTTTGQDADFGATLAYFRAAWLKNSDARSAPGLVPGHLLSGLEKTPAATPVSGALIAITAPAKRVMAAFVYRAENNFVAGSKRLPAEGTFLAQEWGLFIN
jgi:hypothetical protein